MSRALIIRALAFCLAFAAGPSLAECGKGLVLFTVASEVSSPSPPYLKLIEADGWKAEVRTIEPSYARENEYAVALRLDIDAARRSGCRKIALVGESFGAWISLLANASFQTPIDGESVQALVAVDASAAKSAERRDAWHDYKFVNLLKTQDATHLALFLYDASAAEIDERRNEISQSLANRVRDARVFVENETFDGTSGPHGEAFARRYGPVLIEILDGAAPVGMRIQPPPRN
jgi:hypothetical protein